MFSLDPAQGPFCIDLCRADRAGRVLQYRILHYSAGGAMATEAEFQELRVDMKTLRTFLQILHVKKEREIILVRQGKRPGGGEIREMRDLESNIEAILNRRMNVLQTRAGYMFEIYRERYYSAMRSWKARYSIAEKMYQRRMKREEMMNGAVTAVADRRRSARARSGRRS